MKECYKRWIKDNVKDAYGMCDVYTSKMRKVFPELTKIRGHYECPIWGMREHWWLVDEENNIVDPTAHQFPSLGITGFYIPLPEDAEEPTGKCLNCGKYLYGRTNTCNAKCHQEVLDFMGL